MINLIIAALLWIGIIGGSAQAALLIDDFNSGADQNPAGGSSFVLHDNTYGSTLSYDCVSDPAFRFGDDGRILRLRYDMKMPKGWAAWGMELNGLDIHDYDLLRLRVRGSDARAESFTVLLKDMQGNLFSLWTGRLVMPRQEDGWLIVEIPIERKQKTDFSRLDTLMISFDPSDGQGYLLVDDIEMYRRNGSPEPANVAGPSAAETRYAETPVMIAEAITKQDPTIMGDFGPASYSRAAQAADFDPSTHILAAQAETQPEPTPAVPTSSSPDAPTPETLSRTQTTDTAGGRPKILPGPGPLFTAKPAPIPTATYAPPPLTKMEIKPRPAGSTSTGDPEKFLVFDGMDNPKDWQIEGEQGTKLDVTTVGGMKGKALDLTYAFGSGGWVQIVSRKPTMDMTRVDAIRLRIKPVRGTINLEIKITDDDWSAFGKKYEDLEADGEWTTLTIPMQEFTYWWGGDNKLDLKNIRGFYIAITKISDKEGELMLDNLEYHLAPDAAAASTGAGNKILIDSFERSIPENAYQPLTGDKSVLKLESVRDAHDGNYSMRFEYTLETSRGIPTYVGAHSSFAAPLDWTGVDDVNIWVKGNGSTNLFRINLIDRDEEVWSYTDGHILRSGTWERLSIPISAFKLPADATARNRTFDVDEINRIELMVYGDRTEKFTGTVWADELYVTGKNLKPDKVGPAELRRGIAIEAPQLAASFNFGMTNFAEFLADPEEGQKVNHYGKILLDGQLSKYSTRLEIASDAQDYGSSTFFDTGGLLNQDNPRIVLVNSQVNVKDIHPNLRLLTLGYLWIDFGRWAFSPQWGSKGIKAEGSFGPVAYEGFVIKKRYDAFATGTRITVPNGPWLFQGTMVYDDQYAQYTGSTISGNNLVAGTSNRLRMLPISRDLVTLTELSRRLNKDRISVSLLLGRDVNSQYGTVNGTYSPTVARYYASPVQTAGNLGVLTVKTTDYPLKRLALNYEYRWVGTDFKPSFREGGISFDDAWSDQQGYNMRFNQAVWKWNFSGEFDDIKRLSGAFNVRQRKRFSVGYYGIRNIDLAVTVEDFKENYRFSSIRTPFATDKDEAKFSGELYVGFRFSDKMYMWAKAAQERIVHPSAGNAHFTTDIFNTRLEYYISNNMRLFAEHKTTEFGDPGWEPIGSPFTDNFTRLSAELNF